MRRGNFEGKNVICAVNGCLKEEEQQLFFNETQALEKGWTKCISVAGSCVEK